MILHVFDEDFVYRGRVENWINISWVEEYRGEGKFTLVTYDTDKYAEILRMGYFFYRADRPVAMMAVKVERDTEKNQITVNGYTTLHMLDRRVVAYPYECTNIETGIYGLVGENLRGLKNVRCATAKGLTAETDFEIEGTELLYGVFSLLDASEYGIRMLFDHRNKQHVVEVYEGIDRSYNSEHGGTVFSQEFGNLRNLTVTEDDDLYKNVAYITGAAANDSQTIYYQYVSDEAGDDESNWREMLVDGESQEDGQDYGEWQSQQRQRGIEALNERKSALSFEVDMMPSAFGKKFDLGDTVTCKTRRYGLQFNTHIMEYKHTYKKGVETVTLTLGDKPTDYVRSSIVKSGSKSVSGGTGGGSAGTGGQPGKDGVGIQSVTQTTTSTADGGENIITVTLTDGSSNTFSVRNGRTGSSGKDGQDGVSVTHSWDGTVLTVTSASGTSSADLKGAKGNAGADGNDGYTPVRGVDYWTQTDKDEIINEVSAAVGGGGSYKVTLSSSKWSKNSNGTYTQTATISGLTSANKAIVDINMSSATTSTYATLSEAWFLIGRAYCVTNGVTFVCYEGAPTTNLSVNVEVL